MRILTSIEYFGRSNFSWLRHIWGAVDRLAQQSPGFNARSPVGPSFRPIGQERILDLKLGCQDCIGKDLGVECDAKRSDGDHFDVFYLAALAGGRLC